MSDAVAPPALPLARPHTPLRALRADRRGRAALILISLLLAAALLAPVLASDRPLICRHQGRLYFPAPKDLLRRVPVLGRLLPQSSPFDFQSAVPKRLLEHGDFALWPPIPWGRREISPDILAPPSRAHWLGTDEAGRDVTARLLYGCAVSLRIGVLSVALATLVGVLIGWPAGFAGGWTDLLVSRLIEAVACFPAFFLILAATVWVEPGATTVILVVGLTRWTGIARLVRAEVLRLRHHDYVPAARALGLSPLRVALRHVLPGALSPIWVAGALGVGNVILLEAGLSWLGFGVPDPEPAWGSMLRVGFEHLRTAPHLIWAPCAAIFTAVLAFNLLADVLRDALDPTAGTPPGRFRAARD